MRVISSLHSSGLVELNHEVEAVDQLSSAVIWRLVRQATDAVLLRDLHFGTDLGEAVIEAHLVQFSLELQV